ncbi:hypothetical protein KE639_02350 [Streptomyces sp. V17-9]|nr:hypothetical protein KE639_02350 [Streptomyces sp. V17-9]
MDAEGAGRALDGLLTALAPLRVLEVEREFVLYDSDVSVDEGWLEEGPVDEDRPTDRAEGVRR